MYVCSSYEIRLPECTLLVELIAVLRNLFCEPVVLQNLFCEVAFVKHATHNDHCTAVASLCCLVHERDIWLLYDRCEKTTDIRSCAS